MAGGGATRDGGEDGADGKRQYKPAEERREEIVRATLAILAEEGVGAWTTAALARRVGVSEATLFRHFDSKDEILSAAFRRQAREVRARIEAYEPEGSPWERVTGLAGEVLHYMEETEGGPLLILLGHAARIRPDMRDEVERTGGLFRRRLVGFLAGDGTTAPDRAEVLADLVLAVGQSKLLRWSVAGRKGDLVDEAAPLLRVLGECYGKEASP